MSDSDIEISQSESKLFLISSSDFPGSLSYKFKQPNICSPTASDNEQLTPAPSGKRALFKKKAENKKPENVQEKEKTSSEGQEAATNEIPGDRVEVKNSQEECFRSGVLGSIR